MAAKRASKHVVTNVERLFRRCKDECIVPRISWSFLVRTVGERRVDSPPFRPVHRFRQIHAVKERKCATERYPFNMPRYRNYS